MLKIVLAVVAVVISHFGFTDVTAPTVVDTHQVGVPVVENIQDASSAKEVSTSNDQQLNFSASHDDRIDTKEEIVREEIRYQNISKNDAGIPLGEKRITQNGKRGVREKKFNITYKNNQEVGRELVSDIVVTPAIDEIDSIGTKVKQVATPPSSSDNHGYINVDNEYIPSPSLNPQGASAQCRDGSYSYSTHRQGTCSHHGGVAEWL